MASDVSIEKIKFWYLTLPCSPFPEYDQKNLFNNMFALNRFTLVKVKSTSKMIPHVAIIAFY